LYAKEILSIDIFYHMYAISMRHKVGPARWIWDTHFGEGDIAGVSDNIG